MEPEVKEFLQRVSFSIGIAAAWMFINSTVGIWLGLAFIHDHVRVGNIIFYIWFIASIVLMIWMYLRLWRKKV